MVITMNQERLLQRFIRYVACDSESYDEREFCRMIEEELASLGIVPKRQEVGPLCGSNGWNTYSMLPGTGTPLLFSAHLDTVSPGKNISPVIEGGVIRSNGETVLGADDKAGVAAVMEALTAVVESNVKNRPIELLFTICEETGLLGSKHADYSMIESRDAVVLDGEELGSIINRSPAHMKLHIEIQGRSAHAGVSPELGANALKTATDAIAQMQCGYIGDLSVMNVANLLAPGKTNIVPDKAAFDAEIRSHSEEELQSLLCRTKELVQDSCRRYGTSCAIDESRVSNPLHVPEDSALIRTVSDAFRKTGIAPVIQKTFGGCDATWLSENGIASINVGVGMKGVHGCVGAYCGR